MAFRLTWRVLGIMILILSLISALIFGLIWLVGAVGFSALYQTSMDVSNEKINNIFSAVEVALSNNVTEVEETMGNDKKAYYAPMHLLQLNPNIMGAAVAYNPDCEPKKGQPFAPYVYRDSAGIQTKQLNTKEYDYLHKNWYVQPLAMDSDFWSEPYVDIGGGEVLMSTYSMPLTNSKDEIYAVQTADLSLDWIADMKYKVDSIINKDYYFGRDSAGHASCFIVTKQGTFIAHPTNDLEADATIHDFLKKQTGRNSRKIVNEILSESEGMTTFRNKEGDIFSIFHSPIERTGWRMGIIVPDKDIYSIINILIMVLMAIMLFGLLVVGLVCRSAIHRLTKPITRFANSAEEIAKGNFKAELPVIKSKDELLQLHNSFVTMQQSLVNQIEQTRIVNEEKGRIDKELQIANNIQMSMIPKIFPPFPERTDIDVYARLTPAKEVGGDIYDFYIRDEKLFFCIGDVSGKGVPAALVMAVTHTLFRTLSAHEALPNRILAAINHSLTEGNDSSMFVTLFIGVLDLPTGRLRYSNAGHNAPLIISDNEEHMLPCDPNVPIGVMENWKFTIQETTIDLYSTIFLYTDGLTEAEDIHQNQFQDSRIVAAARKASTQPQKLIEQMTLSVHQFVGEAEQNDDQTMLAIQYKREKKNAKFHKSITLPNNIEEIPQLNVFIDEVCEAAGLDMSDTMSVNLALEEAVVNVMDYAYPANAPGEVTIEAEADDERMKFVITDHGIPFDPTAKAEVDTTLSLEERPTGGLGIHLVRQIMDSINYERENDKNVLTLRKKLV
jgi:sigma-B regulation protein RsbU (phosphoserine phosphatase)